MTDKPEDQNQEQNQDQAGADLVAAGQAAAKQAELQAIADEAAAFEAETKKLVREQGKIMGLKFAPNASLDTMVSELKAARELILSDPAPAPALAGTESSQEAKAFEAQKELRLDLLRLVRIKISCLNPAKSDLPGEILTVHNDVVGTIKKFVPYNEAGEAYHVPNILLKMLQRKQFLQIKDPPKGSRAPATKRLVKEYSIEVLSPLTEKELEALRKAQNAAAASSSEGDE